MVVKVYISLCSGLKEVKKRQQKILMILDSKNIKYEILDISEPGKETDKEFMHANSTSKGATASDMDPRHPLPPQVFNDEDYCGDFDQFELANEIDNLEVFLKLSPEEIPQLNKSTLDTSKIDESRPNGKVIETEKPDDDKENKTEEVQNQDDDENKDEAGVDQEDLQKTVEEDSTPDNYSVLAETMLENEAGESTENDESSPSVPDKEEIEEKVVESKEEELDEDELNESKNEDELEASKNEDGESGEDIVEETQSEVKETSSSNANEEEIVEKLSSENISEEIETHATDDQKLEVGDETLGAGEKLDETTEEKVEEEDAAESSDDAKDDQPLEPENETTPETTEPTESEKIIASEQDDH